jgi:hypothetical protein
MPDVASPLDASELARFNREPVSFLAELAQAVGVPYHTAFHRAQGMILSYGTSRRIDMSSAGELSADVLDWAQTYVAANTAR